MLTTLVIDSIQKRSIQRDLWRLRPSRHQASQADRQKIQDATGEKWSTFFYSKVYQWQYNEAMKFVLWVAQKIYLLAWMAYSIFKYIKLKSYEKKNYIYA